MLADHIYPYEQRVLCVSLKYSIIKYITICQILNLTRDYIEEWNFTDLLLKLNLKLLLENVIFGAERKLDTLFLHALQTILNNISGVVNEEAEALKCCNNHSDCKLEVKVTNSANDSLFSSSSSKNSQIIDIIYTNLRRMYAESSDYHTYMVLKQINFENLCQLKEFKALLNKNEEGVKNNDVKLEHNFYNRSNKEKFYNISSLSGDKSILAKKPVDSRNVGGEDFENSQDKQTHMVQGVRTDQNHPTISDTKHLYNDNTRLNTFNEPINTEALHNVNTGEESDFKNLNIGDIDDTFSNITLNNAKIKTKTGHDQDYPNLKIELLSSNQKQRLLEFELSKNDPNREIVSYCLKALLNDYKYASGMVFNKSKVVIRKKLSNFCLYCNFYQYDKIGDQLLFKITAPGGFTALIVRNGQLLKIQVEKGVENVVLLPSPVNNLYALGLEYNNKVLKIHLNEIKLPVTIKGAKLLEVGENFRGIIPRIVYYENVPYNEKYLENLDNISYYAKYINELEKICQYYNHNGVIVDSSMPYFLSKNSFHVNVDNLMINTLYDFLNSEGFTKAFLEKLKKDAEFRSILEQYYMDYNT
ncbi:hypothetical protein THOM_0364 [Trachipleistophora hominis]|uniref:Uncharacterized protein n=1 Tax=Trachipleistophora hominis TaxID=72359 RepID=L7JZ96_TRAHO|nr:hypothetical protein THOM_0364 [Trachipleistophora hominis]